MITERLLFAVHESSVGDRRVGVIMQDHCLPIACSHASWEGAINGQPDRPYLDNGICSYWEYVTDVKKFFRHLGLSSLEGMVDDVNPHGLYVYEVTYDDEGYQNFDTYVGKLRRPTVEELEPLTRGCAPWGGVVL